MSTQHIANLEPILALVKEAFHCGFETCNDSVLNSADECWENWQGIYLSQLSTLATQAAPQQAEPLSLMPHWADGEFTYHGQPARYLGTLNTPNPYRHVIAWRTKLGFEYSTVCTDCDTDVMLGGIKGVK